MSGQVAIDERVRELVRSHRPELIELVDQALAAELDRLVEERLAAAGNGAEHARQAVFVPATKLAAKVCVSCGQAKAAAEFETHRRACRDCRRAEMRERAQQRRDRDHGQAADVEEPPRTDTAPSAEDSLPAS